MPYKSSNLSALAYANGFTLWHYIDFASKEEMLSPDFFLPAHRMLRGGDFIFANTADPNDPLSRGSAPRDCRRTASFILIVVESSAERVSVVGPDLGKPADA